jgi:hypothetical protein
LRGAHLWRTLLDDGGYSGDRWALADLRGVDVDPIEELDVWIEEATQQIGDEETRNRVAEQLRAGLRNNDRPETPRFPKAWRSAPNVVFDPGDPLPQQLGWGTRVWATLDAYDDDLAAFLGELACGAHATVHIAKGLAERTLSNRNRLYAKHLAARLIGDDCPTAAGLPEGMRPELKELAESSKRTQEKLTWSQPKRRSRPWAKGERTMDPTFGCRLHPLNLNRELSAEWFDASLNNLRASDAGPLGAQMAPSNARMPCHNASEIAKQLSTKYDEAPVAFGLQSNGNLLQVYSSEEKGTWTVVSTTPTGVSCIVAAGKHWESLPAVKNDPMA